MPANTGGTRPLFRTDNYNRSHPNFRRSDFWLVDGSYLRVKNVELGYTLPSELTGRVGIERCKVYLSAYNLLTFSKLDYLDPEVETNPSRTFGLYYPPVGTYNLGLMLQF